MLKTLVHTADIKLFGALVTCYFELEKQLKTAKNDYHQLYEFTPIGYFDLDKNNYIIGVNLAGAQLLETPRSCLLGKCFSDYIGRDSRLVFYQYLQQVSAFQITQPCQLELLKSDGSSFYSQLESVPVTDSSQNELRFRLSIINMDKYRLTEQALRASEEKFRSILETTKEWIWTIDLKGRYLYSNSVVRGILGYSENEIINHNHLLLIHKDDRPIVARLLPSLVKSQRGWSDLTLRWCCKDGNYRYLESNAVPFFDLQGKLVGFRGSGRDITLRKQTEEQARRHQAALNQASKTNSLGELASTLAHELTQPLTAINNFITGCIKRLNSSASQKDTLLDALQQASQEAERAGRIIHRIKDFARARKLHYEKINFNIVIHHSIELIKKEFPYSSVKIHFVPKDSIPLIIADKIQLELVMLNLLRNGIEVLSNYSILNPKLQVTCENYSNQHVLVSVSDNGPGFSPDLGVDKIFEACFTTKSSGLGMGLAISRTIIEAHHGSLNAYKNSFGKGACLQFILPVNQKYDDS